MDTSILDSLTPMGAPPPSPGGMGSATSILDSLTPLPPSPSDAAGAQQQSAYPVKPGQQSGYSANIGASIKRGVASGVGTLLGDPLWGAIAGPVDRGPDKMPGVATPVADFLGNLVNPGEVVPGSKGQELAGQAAQGAAAMLTMTPGMIGESVPQTLGTLAKTALVGGAGGASGQVAEDAAPDALKPAAGMLGQIAGSMATEGAAGAAQSAGRYVRRLPGDMGVGPGKQQVGDVRATPGQIAQVGDTLKNAIGPEGRANIEDKFQGQTYYQSPEGQKELADLQQKIDDPATHPDDRADAEAALRQLQERRVSLVPGSEPTTAQLAQTPGASDLESASRVQNDVPFVAKLQAQNNARLAHLQALEPTGADSWSFGQHVANNLADIEAGGQTAIAGKQAAVNAEPGAREGRPVSVGSGLIEDRGQAAIAGKLAAVRAEPIANAGQEPIAQTGAALRGATVGAAAPWQQAARRAWSVVDPDGTWAIGASPLRDAATELQQSISPSGDTNPAILKVINRAASLPDTIKFRDLSQMRADANSVLQKSGHLISDNEKRLVSGIKSGIDQTIAQTIDEKAAGDPTLQARLQQAVGPLGPKTEIPSFGERPGGNGPSAEGVSPASVGEPGQVGRSGNAPGGSALPDGNAAAQRFPGRPQSLVDWIIQRGGIQDPSGDLASMGADAIHHQMGGRLINPKGMPPDQAALGLQAEGFLPQHGPGVNPIGPNDVYDRIAEHISGRPTYGGADLAQAEQYRAGQAAQTQRDRFESRLYDARDQVNSLVDQSGHPPLSPTEQEHAARLVAGGVHPEDAVRSAVRETEETELDRNAAKNAVGSPGVPLAAQQSAMPIRGGGLTPNMEAEHAIQYTDAVKATRDMKEATARGGVGQVLRKGGNFEDFKHPDAAVPGQIFSGKVNEPAEVARWVKLVGPQAAEPIAREAFANELRQKNILSSPDGAINAKRLAEWRASRAEILWQFPRLAREFESVQSAQEALNSAIAAHDQTSKSFQRFTRGSNEAADIARWAQTVGPDKAEPVARDVLANELRERKIISPVDGTINAAKLADWRAARAETLKQFPNLDHEFGSLQSAQEALNDVTAGHVQALKDFQNSAAAKFIGTEPNIAVRRILSGDNPEQSLSDLVRATHGNPDAEASLKRALVDYIVDQHQSVTPSSGGEDMMKQGQFRKFVDRFRGPLKVPFGGQGVQNIEMVAADMRRAAEQPKAVGGSQTASHGARAARTGIGAAAMHGGGLTALALIGEHLGEMVSGHGIGGMVGIAGAVMGKSLWNSFKQAGINTRNDLISYAMLHPEFAREAMAKADARGQISTYNQKRITAALQGAINADMATHMGQRH